MNVNTYPINLLDYQDFDVPDVDMADITSKRFSEQNGILSELLFCQAQDMSDQTLLETILKLTGVKCNTSEVTKALLMQFQSFSKVIAASVSELIMVPDMSITAALLLKFVNGILVRLDQSRSERHFALNTRQGLNEYLMAHRPATNTECIRLLCLDTHFDIIMDEIIVDEPSYDITYFGKTVETAIKSNSQCIILIHHHENHIEIPHQYEVDNIKCLRDKLEMMDIHLWDYVMINLNQTLSLNQASMTKYIPRFVS